MGKVLLVDDDTDFTDAATVVLRKRGHEVSVLNDTRGAIEHLERERPDILVLDVMFPEDSTAGFDLARLIRQHESLERLPILILSAVNTRFPLGFGPGDIDDTWMPVQDFLEKPIDFDVLIQKVERLMKGEAPRGK